MKFLLAANWKMNLSPLEAKSFVESFKKESAQFANRADFLIFPSALCGAKLEAQGIPFGPQNFWPQEDGAYTGENSLAAWSSIGATWALVGHSERRSLFGEDSSLLKKKIEWALKKNFHVVYCIGESLNDRESGNTFSILEKQLSEVYDSQVSSLWKSHLHIAYEPVWAIGTGKVATPEQVEETHLYIRNWLNAKGLAESTAILYGGSVKPENAGQLSGIPHVNGFLVGGASLKASSFLALAQSLKGPQ